MGTEYNTTPLTAEVSMQKFRAIRDSALERWVDYFQMKPLLYDSLSSSEKTDLIDYRQDLLDAPATLLASKGADFVIFNCSTYLPVQPAWFADKHPIGRLHTSSNRA